MVALGSFVATASTQAKAQDNTEPVVINTRAGLSDGNFNTPEAGGRPGAKYLTIGLWAAQKGDHVHAAAMHKVAASWAYKPAEYNLGVMYFNGHGVPVDRALGAAWMVLAAERGNKHYAGARDMMVSLLSDPEFARTDELWGQLIPTYGDKVALRRVKAQWAWVRTRQTGPGPAVRQRV